MKLNLEKNKILTFIFFTIIFIILFIQLYFTFTNNTDCIWNYGFAKYISMGYLPYKDFNMVVTPLWPYINALFLKIVDQAIVLVFTGTIVSFLCFYLIYKIYKLYNISLNNIFFCIIVMFCIPSFLLLYKIWISTYNILLLLLTLIIIYLEMKFKNKNFLIGILGALCVLTKQSTGLLILLVVLIVPLFNKEKIFKLRLIDISKRILGIFGPICFFIFFLLKNDIVDDFTNYTISGLSSFFKLNFMYYFSLLIILIVIFLGTTILLVKTFNKQNDKFIIALYCIVYLSLAFPIADVYHSSIAIIPSLMLFGLIFSQKKNIKIYPLAFIIILVILCLPLIRNILSNDSIVYFNNSNRYKFLPIDKNVKKQIQLVGKYISEEKEKEVVIADPIAAVFMLELDLNKNEYNLLQNGNLGKNGEEKIITKIKKMKNTLILLYNGDLEQNGQYLQKIKEINYFVMNNYKKVDEIGIFDCYYINNE